MWNVEVVIWETVDRVMLIVHWVARGVLLTFDVRLEWNDMDETFVTWEIRNVDFACSSDRFESVIALDSVVVINDSIGDSVDSVAVRLVALDFFYAQVQIFHRGVIHHLFLKWEFKKHFRML